MLCAASQKVGCTELTVRVTGGVRSKSGDKRPQPQLQPAPQPRVFPLSLRSGILEYWVLDSEVMKAHSRPHVLVGESCLCPFTGLVLYSQCTLASASSILHKLFFKKSKVVLQKSQCLPHGCFPYTHCWAPLSTWILPISILFKVSLSKLEFCDTLEEFLSPLGSQSFLCLFSKALLPVISQYFPLHLLLS